MRKSKGEKLQKERGREGVKWKLVKGKREGRGEKQKENIICLPSLVMRHGKRQTE